MKVAIIVNEKRQDAKQLDKANLDALASKYNIDYSLFVKSPSELSTTLVELSRHSYNAYIIGGGDGTVRSAVQILVDQDVPIAVLPLGTFNYFAKELKHSNNIEELFQIIKNNKIKFVDVGEVNGTIFINHSSIGFYAHILKLREKHKATLGRHKLLKVIFTAINFLHVVPIYSLTIEVENNKININTCLIFIGNNYHFTSLLDFGTRKALTSGLMSIYILKCKSRWEIIKCMFSMLFNRFDKAKYFIHYLTSELSITAKSRLINVVIDGELFKLESPLNYTIHKKKLPVFVP